MTLWKNKYFINSLGSAYLERLFSYCYILTGIYLSISFTVGNLYAYEMEMLPEDIILEFSENCLHSVRKTHGLDNPGEMEDAIKILEEWIKCQTHFTKSDFDRGYLERMIITCKGSVERAKQRLDKLCTLRTFMPDYFGDYDVKREFKNLDNVISYVPLPKMGRNFERVFLVQINGKKYDNDFFLNVYRIVAMLIEYLKHHDYANTYRFIFDLREANIGDMIMKLELVELRQIMTLITDGYGLRIKGIHILTNSKMIDTLVSLIKQAISVKLGGRMYVHRSMEAMYEVVPKHIFPKDYGGEETSLHELRVKWLDILSSDEFRSKWREMALARTDESFRPKDTFNNQYMGMPGTFRALTVD